MSVDVRKTIADAGYIAVGIGVLGVQQAQSRGRELQERFSATSGSVNDQAKDAAERLKTSLNEASARAKQFGTDVRGRVEPLVEQFEVRIHVLPEPISKATEPVTRAVKQFAATDAK